MTRGLHPRMDILPPFQQKLWSQLAPVTELGFVLYGGTAIALRLGHRCSVDFDFFSEKPLDRTSLLQQMPVLGQASLVQAEPNTLTFLVTHDQFQEDVKLSFFGAVGFGRVGEPELTVDQAIQIASLDDLVATKVKVILQRAQAKDYQDIAAMLRAGVSLSKGLAAARVFYGSNFQPSESLRALVFFDDGDLHELTQADKDVLIHAVRHVRELPEISIRSRNLRR